MKIRDSQRKDWSAMPFCPAVFCISNTQLFKENIVSKTTQKSGVQGGEQYVLCHF